MAKRKAAATGKAAPKMKEEKPPVPEAAQPKTPHTPGWMRKGTSGGVGAHAPGPGGAQAIPRGAAGMRSVQGPQGQLPAHGAPFNYGQPETQFNAPLAGSLLGGGRYSILFYRHVRRELSAKLVSERGYDWQAAREATNDISEVDIDKMASKLRIGKLGDGSFLQWLIDHGPQILQLIMMLLGMFAMAKPNTAEYKKFGFDGDFDLNEMEIEDDDEEKTPTEEVQGDDDDDEDEEDSDTE